jgi:hypothetical protein
MRHFISDAGDVPPPPPMLDRRRTPDRRTVWRGGRRDSDWHDRPLGALDRLEDGTRRRNSLLHKALSVISLW